MAKRVLLAEDDAAIRKLLVRVFERDGIEVDAVSNGREAIDRLGTNAYDGVVLDLMMPEVNGFDVLRWIRDERAEIARKLIVVTAASERELRHIRAGEVCAVLRKPFDLEQVTQSLRACIA